MMKARDLHEAYDGRGKATPAMRSPGVAIRENRAADIFRRVSSILSETPERMLDLTAKPLRASAQ